MVKIHQIAKTTCVLQGIAVCEIAIALELTVTASCKYLIVTP
jgi:hypothetical protein